MLGFSGYLVFGAPYPQKMLSMKLMASIGLIIGLAYDKITKIIPLFVILWVEYPLWFVPYVILKLSSSYGLMQSSGNLVSYWIPPSSVTV